jgi:hypothetical protein
LSEVLGEFCSIIVNGDCTSNRHCGCESQGGNLGDEAHVGDNAQCNKRACCGVWCDCLRELCNESGWSRDGKQNKERETNEEVVVHIHTWKKTAITIWKLQFGSIA